ncbi:MAG: hypothetical protein Q8M76_17405, partial [Spirochaetaceae bacterium]|nr:hypothetical protein [Spirochaetaceae bacterium]
MKKYRLLAGQFQRNVGLLCALLFAGISGRSAFGLDAGSWFSTIAPLGFALLSFVFLASARFERCRLVQ